MRCFCTGDLPYDKAKKKLITIKGIGPKTADVFLMAIKGEQVLPIDVHIFRIMKRLKIASERDDYESLRGKLESEIPPAKRTKTHQILIEFGSEFAGRRIPNAKNVRSKDIVRLVTFGYASLRPNSTKLNFSSPRSIIP